MLAGEDERKCLSVVKPPYERKRQPEQTKDNTFVTFPLLWQIHNRCNLQKKEFVRVYDATGMRVGDVEETWQLEQEMRLHFKPRTGSRE